MSQPNKSFLARYPAHALGLLSVLLLLFSFRGAYGDPAGAFLGTTTDAVHHAWGLWWHDQPGGEGELTTLVSFPTGEQGALLSPLTAWLVAPLMWIGGPAFAYNGALFLTLALCALSVGLLTARLGRSPEAGAAAAALVLIGRPLQAHIGLGLLEGLAAGWSALALWAAVGWMRRELPQRGQVEHVDQHIQPDQDNNESTGIEESEAAVEPVTEMATEATEETSQDAAESPEEAASPTAPAPAPDHVEQEAPWRRVARALLPWAPWRHRAALATGLLFGVAVIEDPYALVLLLPLAVAIAVARLRGGTLDAAREVVTAALAGGLLTGLRLASVGGNPGGNATTAVRFWWMNRQWTALEGEGRLSLEALINPFPVMTFGGTTSEIIARGGDRYLGWSVLLSAGLGLAFGGRTARLAVALALACLLLAGGSLPLGINGPPGPFFLVNYALSRVLPALTQPDRFMVFASIALAVAGGLGLAAFAARSEGRIWRSALVLLALEGMLLGGPALTVPSTDLREWSCFAALTDAEPYGGTHLVAPKDWSGERGNAFAMTLQLLHRLPGTHRGIGGWRKLAREARLDHALATVDGATWATMASPTLPAAIAELRKAGLAWLLLEEESAPVWLGKPRLACGGWGAWALDGLSQGGRQGGQRAQQGPSSAGPGQQGGPSQQGGPGQQGPGQQGPGQQGPGAQGPGQQGPGRP